MMMGDPRGRLHVLMLCTELAVLAGVTGLVGAKEKTPFPVYGRPGFLVNVPGPYQLVNDTIKQLERSSPQSYFVVVLRKLGTDSATEYVEQSAKSGASRRRKRA